MCLYRMEGRMGGSVFSAVNSPLSLSIAYFPHLFASYPLRLQLIRAGRPVAIFLLLKERSFLDSLHRFSWGMLLFLWIFWAILLWLLVHHVAIYFVFLYHLRFCFKQSITENISFVSYCCLTRSAKGMPL